MAAQDGEVQTVRRALELVDLIAEIGTPIAVSVLADRSTLPVPTVYRLLRTLVAAGYVRQVPGRRYALGLDLVRLGKIAGASLGANVEPFLRDLVAATGETSNFAVLDGDRVVYVAQAPSSHMMRMFTEIGRRVLPHSTGVGKAIMSRLPDDKVAAIVARTGMPASTSLTHTTPDSLFEDLKTIRGRGWAEDDGEQEIGVRCVAAPIVAGDILAAVSISGPRARLSDEVVSRVAAEVTDAAAQIAASLSAE